MPDEPLDLKLYGVGPDFLETWIRRLESGRYDQASMSLRDDSQASKHKIAMCCLGVGCHIIDPKGWHPIEGDTDEAWRDCTGTNVEGLPWLDKRSGNILSGLNDDGEVHDDGTVTVYKFKDIAKLLRGARVRYYKRPRGRAERKRDAGSNILCKYRGHWY